MLDLELVCYHNSIEVECGLAAVVDLKSAFGPVEFEHMIELATSHGQRQVETNRLLCLAVVDWRDSQVEAQLLEHIERLVCLAVVDWSDS